MGEPGRAVQRLPRSGEIAFDIPGLAARERAFDEREAAPDGLQHVVEVMRHAAGELTHRFHFLRLVQLRLAFPQRLIGLSQLRRRGNGQKIGQQTP